MANEGEQSGSTAELNEVKEANEPGGFRSRQQTLAMGGNVNYRERMPTLREMAEEFIEHAPPPTRESQTAPAPEAGEEPERLTDLALRAISEAPPPSAAAVDGTGASTKRALSSLPVPPTPPRSVARLQESSSRPALAQAAPSDGGPETTAPPLAELVARASLPLATTAANDGGAAPAPAAGPPDPDYADEELTTVHPRALPRVEAVAPPAAVEGSETLRLQPLSEPSGADPSPSAADPVDQSPLPSFLDRFRADWSPVNGRYRWRSVGILATAVVFGGFGVTAALSDGPDEKALESTTDSANRKVGDDGRSREVAGALVASKHQSTPGTTKDGPSTATTPPTQDEPAKPTGAAAMNESESSEVERDEHFAVRKPQREESCEDVLGEPFEVEAEPHAGKAGAYWSRSRKSLMRGKSQSALKQMCLSASWDLAGRGTYGLSEYYFKHSDFDQALRWAKLVPEGSKRYGDARTMIGDIYSQRGEPRAALDAFLSYWNIEADAETERAELASRFVNSAAIAQRKGDWWTAERFYRRALALDAEHALAAAGLARAFAHFELHEAAVYWGERALSLDDGSTQAALALCETWISRKDQAKAEQALQRLQQVAPSHPRAKLIARQIRQLD